MLFSLVSRMDSGGVLHGIVLTCVLGFSVVFESLTGYQYRNSPQVAHSSDDIGQEVTSASAFSNSEHPLHDIGAFLAQPFDSQSDGLDHGLTSRDQHESSWNKAHVQHGRHDHRIPHDGPKLTEEFQSSGRHLVSSSPSRYVMDGKQSAFLTETSIPPSRNRPTISPQVPQHGWYNKDPLKNPKPMAGFDLNVSPADQTFEAAFAAHQTVKADETIKLVILNNKYKFFAWIGFDSDIVDHRKVEQMETRVRNLVKMYQKPNSQESRSQSDLPGPSILNSQRTSFSQMDPRAGGSVQSFTITSPLLQDLVSLLKRVWCLNHRLLELIGASSQYDLIKNEQSYLQEWLLHKILGPILARNAVGSSTSQDSSLDFFHDLISKYLQLDTRKVFKGARIRRKNTPPEPLIVFQKIMKMTELAVHLIGSYYKTTNKLKWEAMKDDYEFLKLLVVIQNRAHLRQWPKFIDNQLKRMHLVVLGDHHVEDPNVELQFLPWASTGSAVTMERLKGFFGACAESFKDNIVEFNE